MQYFGKLLYEYNSINNRPYRFINKINSNLLIKKYRADLLDLDIFTFLDSISTIILQLNGQCDIEYGKIYYSFYNSYINIFNSNKNNMYNIVYTSSGKTIEVLNKYTTSFSIYKHDKIKNRTIQEEWNKLEEEIKNDLFNLFIEKILKHKKYKGVRK